MSLAKCELGRGVCADELELALICCALPAPLSLTRVAHLLKLLTLILNYKEYSAVAAWLMSAVARTSANATGARRDIREARHLTTNPRNRARPPPPPPPPKPTVCPYVPEAPSVRAASDRQTNEFLYIFLSTIHSTHLSSCFF